MGAHAAGLEHEEVCVGGQVEQELPDVAEGRLKPARGRRGLPEDVEQPHQLRLIEAKGLRQHRAAAGQDGRLGGRALVGRDQGALDHEAHGRAAVPEEQVVAHGERQGRPGRGRVVLSCSSDHRSVGAAQVLVMPGVTAPAHPRMGGADPRVIEAHVADRHPSDRRHPAGDVEDLAAVGAQPEPAHEKLKRWMRCCARTQEGPGGRSATCTSRRTPPACRRRFLR